MVSSFLLYGGTAGFALGIFIQSFVTVASAEILFLCLISAVLIVVWVRTRINKNSLYVLVSAIFLFSVACGIIRMDHATQTLRQPFFETVVETEVALEGTVIQEVDTRTNSKHLYVETLQGLLLVTADRNTVVSYGDVVTFKGVLQRPEPFETDLGRTFNYPGYLKARGVSFMVPFAKVEVIGQGEGNKVIATLLAFKYVCMSHIEKVLAHPHAGLSQGLLLGVKKALGEDLETAFRKTGIIHIVVLSGYNIMLVVTFVMFFLSSIFSLRLRLVFGAIAIVLFACMVGLSSTVVRASAMALLVLLAQATGRTYAVVRALLITALFMLLYNPYLLAFDVGFQLSFIATLGLILVAPELETYVGFMPKIVGLRTFLTATLATQLFVTPILLYQIGEFSVVAVIVNLLVLPMVPVAMLLTFATALIGFISIQASLVVGYVAYLSLSYIITVATFFADLPFVSVTVPLFPFYIVILVYVMYGYILWYLYHRSAHVHHMLRGWTIVEEDRYREKLHNVFKT